MSPLVRRLPRDLRHNAGKYLGIFALLVMAIMFTSGYLAAAASINDIATGMRDAYNVEDLYFVTMYEAPQEALTAVEGMGCAVFENFSRDLRLDLSGALNKDMTVRVYANRTGEFDAAVYASGRAPRADHEVALDRVFCQNHALSLGDTVRIADENFELVGICTLADYQVTYKNAGDFMFNATSFTVAQVTPEELERLVGDGATFRYSVVLDDRDMDLAGRSDFEEELVDVVDEHGATVSDLVDADANIGLTFAADDVEGDMVMWEVLMMILIVIMAFVFVVLTDATIEQESSVIGTLLASGYRKRELIAHYLALPCLVGIVGCSVGVVLGYTLMAAPMQGLYYNSYSFPPYVAGWHWDVFAFTTLVPFALLSGITWLGLARKLGATPLQFLRGEASRRSRRSGMRLSARLGFVQRFRLRVFMRNLSHFVTLFFGIMFGSLLLLMGLAMLPIVSINADLMADSVPAEHLYTLKAQLRLDGTDGERRAWAAAFELETNPAYDALDLELLGDLADRLEAAGVDLGTIAGDGEGSGEFELPRQLEDMVEDSAQNDDWRADDPAVHALWRQVASAAGVTLDCSDAELTAIVETADRFHRQLHSLDDDALDEAFDLLEELMDAAADDSVDLDALEDPVNQTAIDDATLEQVEPFAAVTLAVPRRIGDSTEQVTVYGIRPDSRYWDYANGTSETLAIAGRGLLEKCDVELGASFEALDRYTNTTYELHVDAVCSNGCDLNIYMDIDTFNAFFGEEAGHFNGYASDVELPLDERYVASDLTPDKMRSMADQMEDSMGAIMRMMVILVIPVYLVLIYLLTKTVIDRSGRAISYMKVFGYHDGEIDRLYLRAVTITVVASLVLCVPILLELFRAVLVLMMARYSGNFVIEVPLVLMAEEVAIGIASYLVVVLLHRAAIRRVPLALALKVTE